MEYWHFAKDAALTSHLGHFLEKKVSWRYPSPPPSAPSCSPRGPNEASEQVRLAWHSLSSMYWLHPLAGADNWLATPKSCQPSSAHSSLGPLVDYLRHCRRAGPSAHGIRRGVLLCLAICNALQALQDDSTEPTHVRSPGRVGKAMLGPKHLKGESQKGKTNTGVFKTKGQGGCRKQMPKVGVPPRVWEKTKAIQSLWNVEVGVTVKQKTNNRAGNVFPQGMGVSSERVMNRTKVNPLGGHWQTKLSQWLGRGSICYWLCWKK